MALSTYFNRVMFLSTTGGLSDFIVGSPLVGYNTPAQRGVPNNAVVSYTATSQDLSQWETGQGTYTAATGTVVRSTIRESTNGGAKVNFSTLPIVWLDYHAQDTPVIFGSATQGVVPASGGGTTNFLRADGAWAPATAGAAGLNTQLQYNNAGALAGITNVTSNGTNAFLTAIAAPAAPAAGFGVFYVDSTNKVLALKNDAGTVSSTVVPSTAAANQFATGISAAGVITYAQPSYSNLSGSPTAGGSTTQVQYNNAGLLAGITNLTSNGTNPLLTAISAPAAPASGFGVFYEDSTQLIFTFKNASGTVSNTVVASSAAAHQFATAISAAGAVTWTQPAIGDLANIANNTIVGNNSGSSGPPLALTAAQVNTLLGTPTGSAASGQVAYWNGTSTITGDAGLTYTSQGQLVIALGTITTNNKALSITGTFNAAVVFDAPFLLNITNTSSTNTSKLADIQVGGTSQVAIDVNGNTLTNATGSALATSATTKFLMIGNCAGVPTGVVSPTYTGATPLVVDTTDSRLYGFIGGAWVNLTGSGGGSVTGSGANTDVAFWTSATNLSGDSGFTYAGSGQATLALGSITANKIALNITATFNNSGVTFDAPLLMNVVNTASNSSSLLVDVQVGGSTVWDVNVQGQTQQAGLAWIKTQTGGVAFGNAFDASLSYAGANTLSIDNGNFNTATGTLKLANLQVSTSLFGFNNNGTNGAGSNITQTPALSTGGGAPGNWIVQNGFTGTGASGTCTISNASPAVITIAAHNFFVGEPVLFSTTGSLPTGLSTLTTYYISVTSFAAGAFDVATSYANALAGTNVNTSSAGSGTQTVSPGGVCTISNASPAVITLNNHGLVPGMVVQFSANGGTLPTGLSAATNYFVISAGLTVNAFEVSASLNGAAVNTSTAGSGTFTVLYQGGSQANSSYAVATFGPSQLTGAQTTPALLINQVWNTTTGVPDAALAINVTNVGQVAGSLMADWQIGGKSFFQFGMGQPIDTAVGNTGGANSAFFAIYNNNGATFDRGGLDWCTATNILTLATYSSTGANRQIAIALGQVRYFGTNQSGSLTNNMAAGSGISIGWSSTTDPNSGAMDVNLVRNQAAGALALFNNNAPTTGTEFRVYNTWDGVNTNYERGIFGFITNGNVLSIGTANGGTGSQRIVGLMCHNSFFAGLDTSGSMGFGAGAPITASGTVFTGCAVAIANFGATISNGGVLGWSSAGSFNSNVNNGDTGLYRSSAQVIGLGNGVNVDVAAPAANLGLKLQSALAGTAVNIAGSTFTETGSLSTGGGTPGTWIHATGFTGTGAAATATISNASPAVITVAAHNYFIGEPFTLTTTGTLPTGFSTLTTYYIVSAGFGAGAFEASTTFGGAAVNTSTAGSGTHTVNPGGVCTISNASPAVITLNNHGLVPGMVVQFSANGGTLPTGLSAATNYFVISAGLTANAFEVSTTLNGTAVNTSSAGSGTFTVLYQGGTVQNPAYTLAIWGPSQLTGAQQTPVNSPALNVTQLFNNGSVVGTTTFTVAQQQLLFGNGTLASGLKIYNTVDSIASPVNYERGVFDWTTVANQLTIGTAAGGTGTVRKVIITAGAAISFPSGVVVDPSLSQYFYFNGSAATMGINNLGVPVILADAGKQHLSFGASAGALLAQVGDSGIGRVAAKVMSLTDGTAQNVNGWMQWAGEARLDADFSATSNTTLANVTGTTHSLTVTLQAGRNYIFDICLEMVTGATAGGIKIGIGGTATVTNLIADGFCHDGTTIVAVTRVSASPGTLVANTNAGTAPVARFQGTFECNAAGTFTIQFAQNASSATASTVKRGSYMKVHDAP